MKKSVILFFVALTLCATPAYSYWVGSVADSAGNFTANNVQTFDWSASGSGLGVDIGPFGTSLTVGDQFDFLYQAFLIGLTDPTGTNVPFAGLNSSFEYTVVATVPEEVTFVSPDGSLAQFKTLTGAQFYIYYDGAPNVDVPSGLGFDDGVLVASGNISPDILSFFSAISPTEGVGSFIFSGAVDYVNPLYLDPTTLQNAIVSFRAEGTINYPPIESTTTNFFDSRAGEGNFATIPVGADDLLFKVDASSKFNVIPEPSTFLLLACGLLGLVGICRKKAKQ